LLAIPLLTAAAFLWLNGMAERPAPAEPIGGPFTLVDGAGRTVTDRDFRGQYLLIYFGYTFCPDACPTTLDDVAAALDRLGAKASRVQPLFITVDPKRDKPDVVGRYAAAFSPRLMGLSGSPEAIDAVLKEYHVYAAAQPAGGTGSYTIDHSSVLYLMGPDGRFVATLPADAGGDKIAAGIAAHLS
jgi:protein SCO1/2